MFKQSDIIHAVKKAESTYDAAAVLQQAVAKRLLDRLDMILIEPKVILDLGAGTGYCTQLLEKRYPDASIISVDLVDLAGVHCCADANHLPFLDHSIDLVVSSLMLHWCDDVGGIFKEICRVIKPEGLFLFSLLGHDTLKELRDSWAKVDTHPHVHRFFDMHDLGDCLLQSAFTGPVVDNEAIVIAYRDVLGLMQDLKAAGEHNLDPERHRGLTGKRYFEAFLAHYDAYRLDDQTLPATYEVIYGLAWGASDKKPGEFSVPLSDIGRTDRS